MFQKTTRLFSERRSERIWKQYTLLYLVPLSLFSFEMHLCLTQHTYTLQGHPHWFQWRCCHVCHIPNRACSTALPTPPPDKYYLLVFVGTTHNSLLGCPAPPTYRQRFQECVQPPLSAVVTFATLVRVESDFRPTAFPKLIDEINKLLTTGEQP